MRITSSLRATAFAAGAAALCASATGCIAVAAGAAAGYGAYKMTSNGESRSFRAPLDRTWAAALATMREHGYPIGDVPLSPGGGRVTMNGLTVDVTAETAELSRVTVKQGTFDTAGHRATESLVLDGIARRLGVAP